MNQTLPVSLSYVQLICNWMLTHSPATNIGF